MGGLDRRQNAPRAFGALGGEVALVSAPLLLFLWLVVTVALSAPRALQDVAMYLQAAGLLLDGQRPYVDFIDLNPPLVFYLDTIPVALARWTGVHSIRVLGLLVALLAGWSARSVWATLSRGSGREGRLAASLVASRLLGLSIWLFAEGDYAQREHLLFLLYVPYLCARISAESAERGVGAFLRGVAAGLGICLKPHYVLLVLAVEAYRFWLRRDLRSLVSADSLGLATAILAYAGHFALLPSDIRDAFLYRWVPFTARGYAAYDNPEFVWHPTVYVAIVFALICLGVRLAWRGALADMTAAFAIATLVSAAMVILQNKAWVYHRIPMLGFQAAALGCLVAALIGRFERNARPSRLWLGTASAIVLPLVLLVSALAANQGSVRLVYPERADALRPFVQRYTRPGDRVLVCSTFPEPGYPLLTEEGRLPGSRYLWLFPIGMLGNTRHTPEESARVDAELRRVLDELKQDIAASPPALVITRAIAPDDNLTGFLRDQGVFSSLSDFRQVGEAEGYWVFAPASRPQ